MFGKGSGQILHLIWRATKGIREFLHNNLSDQLEDYQIQFLSASSPINPSWP